MGQQWWVVCIHCLLVRWRARSIHFLEYRSYLGSQQLENGFSTVRADRLGSSDGSKQTVFHLKSQYFLAPRFYIGEGQRWFRRRIRSEAWCQCRFWAPDLAAHRMDHWFQWSFWSHRTQLWHTSLSHLCLYRPQSRRPHDTQWMECCPSCGILWLDLYQPNMVK